MLSIIIATYNSSATLSIALESVKNQTFQDWECIIVDGLSKDNTIEIVKEYCEKDKRFRFISEKDQGIYDAFNKGWKMAKGEWVHYLGDDDRLTSNGMASLLAAPDLDNYEVITGHCFIEKIDGTIKENRSQGFMGCHQGKLTRRSTLERFGGFDEQFRILADKDLMLRMEREGVMIKNYDVFVAFFSMTGMSQDLKSLGKRSKELYKIYLKNQKPFALKKTVHYYLNSFASISYRKIKTKIKTH